MLNNKFLLNTVSIEKGQTYNEWIIFMFNDLFTDMSLLVENILAFSSFDASSNFQQVLNLEKILFEIDIRKNISQDIIKYIIEIFLETIFHMKKFFEVLKEVDLDKLTECFLKRFILFIQNKESIFYEDLEKQIKSFLKIYLEVRV
eukprot:snap_masked-scaffold_135-processed-gene-0.2-mRNA-1 protein AED:1.00 eAED:1.00 QI:0/0/0/0/1/1/3/0/145